MSKQLEKILILLTDLFTINLAWAVFFYIRVESGLFKLFTEPIFFLSMATVYIYWVITFTFVGMYRTWFASSRFDEMLTLFKATFVGIFILFFLILYDDSVNGVASTNRFLILIYWMLLLFFIGNGRLFIRSIQRRLLIKGIGRKNAILVGFNARSKNMHEMISSYRGLGIDVVAYVAVKEKNVGKEYNNIKVVNTVHNIKQVIKETNASEIILALDKYEGDVMLEVVALCDSNDVSIKIIPDLYEIISGQARTSQLYGFPLIDIMPQLMPEWEKKLKRLMDIIISTFIIILGFPIILITGIFIKTESK